MMNPEATNTTAPIPPMLRLCYVNGTKARFHTWEHYAKPVDGGLTIGSHPAGQFSQCYGIVEYMDGTIDRVDPCSIKFIMKGINENEKNN